MPKTALKVAGMIFSIVALLHLSRIALQWELLIGGWAVPFWVNGVGAAVAGSMACWMFKTGKNL